MKVLHTAQWVSDLEVSANFYTELLGFDYLMDFEYEGTEHHYVVSSNGGELQLMYDPDRDVDPQYEIIEDTSITIPQSHVSLIVESVDDEFERITTETDCEVIQEPITHEVDESSGSRIAYVTDPDGYVIDLVERIGDNHPGKVDTSGVILDHTAVWISDLDAAREFYVDALGLTYHWDLVHEGIGESFVGGDEGPTIKLMYDDSRDLAPNPGTVDHIGIGVDDADAAFERLVEQTGCTVTMEPTTVVIDDGESRVAYVEDFDGYEVELVERRGDHPADR